MSNKFLQRAFLLSAILFFSGGIKANIEWYNGDIVGRDGTNAAVKWVIDEDLEIFGDGSSTDVTISVSRDVYIMSRISDLTVTITSQNVKIQPQDFYNGDSLTGGWGHVIFCPETIDRIITVICDFDLTFSGIMNPLLTGNNTDLIVTFSGQGTTIFKLKDYNSTFGWRGAQVAFDGFQKGGYADSGSVSTITKAGTRVYILMDQTEEQAVTDGRNKVVFQRKEYSGSYGGLPVGVKVGNASFITYLSTNPTGNAGCPEEVSVNPYAGANGDFGSIAFDPTHVGTGRMYLKLARNVELDTAFGDGGVVVSGHFVPHFTEEAIRTQTYLNAVAGRKAIFRITDDLRYSSPVTDPTDAQAKGLLVINECLHIPKMANDPYQERNIWSSTHTDGTHPNSSNYWARDYAWSQAARSLSGLAPDAYLNVQPGFILGINGRMDIYHRTFLDYVAAQDQTVDFLATGDFSTYRDLAYATELATSAVFKFRNPSAFHVDGLNYYSNTNGYIDSGYDNYNIYDPENGLPSSPNAINPNAEIFMYGDAKTLFRSGLNPSTGRVSEADGGRDTIYGPWYDSTSVSYVYTFTIDSQTYNSQYIPSTNVTGDEGRNVIDIEGPLTVRKFTRAEAPARTYGVTDALEDEAVVNLPTVSIDSTGREYDYVAGSPITRPLTKDTVSYQIYDSPSVFLNDHVEFYNVIYANGDITKPLQTNPMDALPNFVGAERKFFNENVFPTLSGNPLVKEHYQLPNFRLYNSRFDLHEHFVASGCRFVVRDQTNYLAPLLTNNVLSLVGTAANNMSMLKFYDHGDQLDTLDHAFGRLFMASCANNKMSDGTTNETTENCTINVYRKNQISGDIPADTIKLSLQSADDDIAMLTYIVDTTDAERAHHLILLNRPYYGVGLIDIGWTTTYGDKTKYPWESVSSLGSNYFDINVTTSGDPNVGITDTPPATMSIDGNYFYFGGTDSIGSKAVIPVISTGLGSVIYVNHGGRISSTQPTGLDSIHGYDAFMDLPIAYRLWSYDGLRGIIDLPKDQTMYGYGFGRQPYNINTVLTDAGSPIGTHLDTYNSSRVDGYSGRISSDRYSGEEYILAWRNRVDENSPVKSPSIKSMITRFTGIIDEAVTMPTNILYFGAGADWADIVTQLKVSGATIADPMHLLVDGYATGPGYAWIKEIVSIPSSPSVHGEGDHGIIFLRNGGRIGLGNNSWNGHSLNSWKLLGKDYLTISLAGNGTIDLNSDVFVVDRGAFVAESNFGETEVNRLTINLNGNDLYIPAGGELDLSSFGHNAYRQEIEFAGEGRVIFGHGATIRFPKGITPTSVGDAPVLYFNDSTKLVIEDDPEFGKGKYTTLAAADVDKVKIVGIGQIWLNKDSRFEIMGGAKVRVGSDVDTPYTWLSISIQRQGDFVIGDEQERGGSFEVGNVVAGTASGEDESTINFELTLNGEKARTHLDRGAFMGFGVGVIDKSNDNMNGGSTLALNPVVNSVTGNVNFSPDTENAWKIQTLYDVNQIDIYINKGIFDHSNIFNGSDRKASMLAIGPVYPYTYGTLDGSYSLELSDPDRSKILAGGNLMLLEGDGVSASVNAWSFVDPVARETQQDEEEVEDYGMYNMLGADMIVQQQKVASFANSTVTKLSGGGIRIETGTGGSKDFFDFISTTKYTELDTKMVNCSETEYRAYISYINTPNPSNNYSYADANEIYRLTGLSVIGDGRPEDGTEIGILGATGTNEPVMYTVVNRK